MCVCVCVVVLAVCAHQILNMPTTIGWQSSK